MFYSYQLGLIWLMSNHNFRVEGQTFNESTLKLLQVFMRHGDRTPFTVYPNDPYTEDDFFPVGMGLLTPAGKNRAYNVGVELRKVYGNFLGSIYLPTLVKAYPCEFPRCQVSLMLALSALFPPIGRQRYRNDLHWQPIPYHSSGGYEKIFKVYKICSNFNKYVQDRELTKEYREAMEPYAHIIAFARNGSGEYRKQHLFSYFMYTTLLSETESGLPLPEWAKLVFPASLYGAAKTEVDQMYKGPNRILGGGYLMNKILLDCEDIADDDSDSDPEDETKLYMYSGHDMNIAAILCWLNVFQPHLSNYASYLTFELHIVDGEKYLKIMYQNYEYMEPENIMIPNCGFYCPINKFKELFADDLEPEKYC